MPRGDISEREGTRAAVGPHWRRRLAVTPAVAPAAETEPAKTRRLEAVLLVAREPQHVRKLAVLANLADGTEARTLIRRLNEHYDRVGRAFRIEQVAGGWQLATRPQFATWLRRLDDSLGEIRLSSPALETLAIIAYRQPVVRADVEAIRGVHCGEVIRQLMDRGLVRIAGRGDELGRPYLYATTKSFLHLFGLPTIESLPRYEMLKAPLLTATRQLPENPANSIDSNPSHNDSPSPSQGSPELKEPAVKITTISGRAIADPTELDRAAAMTAATVAWDGPRADDDFEDEEDEDEFDDDEEEFDDEDDEEFEDDDDFDDDEEDDDYDDDEEDDDDWEEVDDEDDDEEDDEEFEDDEEEDFDDDDDDDGVRRRRRGRRRLGRRGRRRRVGLSRGEAASF